MAAFPKVPASVRLFVLGVSLLASACSPQAASAPQPPAFLLSGRVTDAGGQPLAGVPVKAHRTDSNVAVIVYTDGSGAYAFPSWSDLTPGGYDLTITLPDFAHVKREDVAVSAGAATQIDFRLSPRTPTLDDASATDIAMALPGTDEQKLLLTQCSNCHSLQWALKTGRTKEDWIRVIRKMAGERSISRDAPGARTYAQKRFLEPLAEYLAAIRGPGQDGPLPFKLRPRPTDEASTRLVLTEYELPRGGQWERYMLRGDPRFVWPHDVIVDQNYAWYTDHFHYVLGRLDKKTGVATELPYPLPPGGGREQVSLEQLRAGNPGGGSHDLLFDSRGNIVIGMDDATVRYDPKANRFVHWTSGNNMFGIDAEDHVWHTDDGGPLFEIDTRSGTIVRHDIPSNDGVYDMDTDKKGRTLINIWRNGKIGVFDPETNSYRQYATPSPESGPRRGEIDDQGRLWVALYYAGRLARFDPDSGAVKEYPLLPGVAAFAAPWLAPYTTSVDNEHQAVWTTDFNSSRLFRFDMKTETATEYMLPEPYEMRDLTVERGTTRPTLWIPSYRPPSKLVKVQIR